MKSYFPYISSFIYFIDFFNFFLLISNFQILNENEIENFTEEDLVENKNENKNKNENGSDMDDEIDNINDNQNFGPDDNKSNSNNSTNIKLNQTDNNQFRNTTKIKDNQKNITKVSGLIFRIISMDSIKNELRSNFVSTSSSSVPILTRSLELGYQTIMDAVQAINSKAIREFGFRQISRYSSIRNNNENTDNKDILTSTSFSTTSSASSTTSSTSLSAPSTSLSSHNTHNVIKNIFDPNQPSMTSHVPSFGLTAAQFFGLGLPYVRHAIEIIPESCAAIICPVPAPQYRPSYRLPSKVKKIEINLFDVLLNKIAALYHIICTCTLCT